MIFNPWGVRQACGLVPPGESWIRHDRQLCLEKPISMSLDYWMFWRYLLINLKLHAVWNISHVGMKIKVHIKSYKIKVFRLWKWIVDIDCKTMLVYNVLNSLSPGRIILTLHLLGMFLTIITKLRIKTIKWRCKMFWYDIIHENKCSLS